MISSSFKIILEECKGGIKTLSPAYFALVMASGIISIGSYLIKFYPVAYFLFYLNNLFYIVLWAFTILRIIWYPACFAADLKDHISGTGFFTTVAGTCVLGIQYLILFRYYQVAGVLLIFGILLWVALTYSIFTLLTTKKDKPALDKGITGGWLTAIVATQSVSILTSLMAPHVKGNYWLEINFFALSMWLWGGMFYSWMISLIFYRYTFFKFSPGDLAPPYWINMGAMAISALGGSVLIINAPGAPLLESIIPFIKGFTILYWATGTWWIPMLIILAFWRHVYKKYPFKYEPLYWGAIFPQGMYAVCTFRMSQALELPFLHHFFEVFLYISLFTWALAFTGLLRSLALGCKKIANRINAP